MANTAALISGTILSDANRRANTGGNFILTGREFEDFNPISQGQTAKNISVIESQIGLDFSGAVPGTEYEFQTTWTLKNGSGAPVIHSSFLMSSHTSQQQL